MLDIKLTALIFASVAAGAATTSWFRGDAAEARETTLPPKIERRAPPKSAAVPIDDGRALTLAVRKPSRAAD